MALVENSINLNTDETMKIITSMEIKDIMDVSKINDIPNITKIMDIKDHTKILDGRYIKDISVIDEPIYIYNIDDVYQVMDLPNLKKCTFIMTQQCIDPLIEDMLEQYLETDLTKEPFISWFSYVLNSIEYYYNRHRTIKDVNFSFIEQYVHPNGDYIYQHIININNGSLTITDKYKSDKVNGSSEWVINFDSKYEHDDVIDWDHVTICHTKTSMYGTETESYPVDDNFKILITSLSKYLK